jgi:hypothetical protein
LTNYLPKTAAEKIKEYENLALEIINIWKLDNVSIYPLVEIAEGWSPKTS